MTDDAAPTPDAQPQTEGPAPRRVASGEEPDATRSSGRARKRTVRLAAFAGVCAAAFMLVYRLGDIFAPVLGALALAYMLDPLVRRLENRGWSRKRAVLAIFAAVVSVVVVLAAASVPFVVRDIMETVDEVDNWIEAESKGATPRGGATPGGGASSPGGIVAALQRNETLKGLFEWLEKKGAWESALKQLRENAREIAGRGMDVAKGGLMFLSRLGFVAFMVVLFPVYLFFFMLGLGGWWDAALTVVPPSYRPRTERIAGELGVSLAAFFRGRLVVVLAIGVVTAAAFAVVGLRFGIVLGLLIGVASIVPFLNVVFLVPALVVALADSQCCWEIGAFWRLAVVFGLYAAGQALDPVLTPYLLSRGTGLHPVTILVSIFVWSRLLGLTGLLLAVPLTASLKILGRELLLPILAGEKADDPDPAGPPPASRSVPGAAEAPAESG